MTNLQTIQKEVVTEQSNNDEASSKTYQTLYSKQDNNDIKGKVSNTISTSSIYGSRRTSAWHLYHCSK